MISYNLTNFYGDNGELMEEFLNIDPEEVLRFGI